MKDALDKAIKNMDVILEQGKEYYIPTKNFVGKYAGSAEDPKNKKTVHVFSDGKRIVTIGNLGTKIAIPVKK